MKSARILLAFVASLVLTTPSRAQDTAAETQGTTENGDRASAFRAVSGPQVDRVPGGRLLIGAYGAAWILLVLFVWRIGSVQRRANDELKALEQSLGEK